MPRRVASHLAPRRDGACLPLARRLLGGLRRRMKLSEAARTLLFERLDSSEKLEIVMTLHGSSGRAVPIERLASTLRLHGPPLRRALAELRRDLLLHETADREVLLLPPSTHDAAALDELSAAHALDRESLHALLVERVLERIGRDNKGGPQ